MKFAPRFLSPFPRTLLCVGGITSHLVGVVWLLSGMASCSTKVRMGEDV